MTMDIKDSRGFMIQPCGAMPSIFMNSFKGPKVGSNMYCHTNDIATIEVTIGRKNNNRHNRARGLVALSRSATTSETIGIKIIFAPTNRKVFSSDLIKRPSVRRTR